MKIIFDIPDNSKALVTTFAVTDIVKDGISFTMTTKTIGTEALKEGATFAITLPDSKKGEV